MWKVKYLYWHNTTFYKHNTATLDFLIFVQEREERKAQMYKAIKNTVKEQTSASAHTDETLGGPRVNKRSQLEMVGPQGSTWWPLVFTLSTLSWSSYSSTKFIYYPWSVLAMIRHYAQCCLGNYLQVKYIVLRWLILRRYKIERCISQFVEYLSVQTQGGSWQSDEYINRWRKGKSLITPYITGKK